MTRQSPCRRGAPEKLIERAKALGGAEFAARLGELIVVIQFEQGLPRDDTWSPEVVRKHVRPILSSGARLLTAIEEASEWLRIFANEELTDASETGEFFDGPLPQYVEDAKRSVADLLDLSKRLDKSLSRKRPDRDRMIYVGTLKGHFMRCRVEWTSTCPVDPSADNQRASLAVEAVACALGMSFQAASKAIQRMDK